MTKAKFTPKSALVDEKGIPGDYTSEQVGKAIAEVVAEEENKKFTTFQKSTSFGLLFPPFTQSRPFARSLQKVG